MWLKLRSLLTRIFTAKLNVWAVLVLVVLLVGGYIGYQHAKIDHQSLHVMVDLFNNCMAKPECKAQFMPPPAGK